MSPLVPLKRFNRAYNVTTIKYMLSHLMHVGFVGNHIHVCVVFLLEEAIVPGGN